MDSDADTLLTDSSAGTGQGPPLPRYPNLRPWKPGQSGNPSGVKGRKHRDIVKTAEQMADAALETMQKLLRSKDDNVALRAAQAILDRAVGKPAQSVDVTTAQKTDATQLSESELLAIAAVGSERADPPPESAGEPDRVH